MPGKSLYFVGFLLLISLLLLGCNLSFQASQVPLDAAAPQFIVYAPPGSTPTPTPFQPQAPTPTYLPAIYPTSTPDPVEVVITPETAFPTQEAVNWANYPGPTIWPEIQIPAPAGLFPQPAGQINILLLGSDQRPNDGGFRTDTILLLTLNTELGTANLTSFPRDLYVYIPGWTINRINTAFAHGGFEALALTMEYNFGVRPDYYIVINFSSFKQVIDSLGGVTVNVGATLTDHRDGYGDYTVYAGQNWMDGETALWYVRSRYSSSDFDRTRRQQEVLEAAFFKVLSLDGLSRAPQLYQVYVNNVTTNMTFDQISPLLPLAAQLADSSRLHSYFIGRPQIESYLTSAGGQVLLPLREPCLEVMRKALNQP